MSADTGLPESRRPQTAEHCLGVVPVARAATDPRQQHAQKFVRCVAQVFSVKSAMHTSTRSYNKQKSADPACADHSKLRADLIWSNDCVNIQEAGHVSGLWHSNELLLGGSE